MTTTRPLAERAQADPGHDGADSGAGSAAVAAQAPAGPARTRWSQLGPVLPARFRPITRPMPWIEIALIGISYYFYRLTQIAAPRHEDQAFSRGFDILRLEKTLHINFEHWLNHAVNGVEWLVIPMNYYYATLHFIVPIVVLVWVYWKFPDRYRSIRTVMFAMTGLALIGFYFYALCPPRLLYPAGDPHAFVDTFFVHHTWGNKTSNGPAGLGDSSANVFAAMPSLHVGWSVWCALTIAHLAQRKWVKVLGVVYPCATFIVIISTANHYVLDAVGGLVVLGAGFLVQRILLGRPAFAPAAVDGSGVPRQATTVDEDVPSGAGARA